MRERLLGVREVAERLHVTRCTVFVWTRKGIIRGVPVGARDHGYEPEEVERVRRLLLPPEKRRRCYVFA